MRTIEAFGNYSGGCRGYWPNNEGKAPGDLRKPGADSMDIRSNLPYSGCAKTHEAGEAVGLGFSENRFDQECETRPKIYVESMGHVTEGCCEECKSVVELWKGGAVCHRHGQDSYEEDPGELR